MILNKKLISIFITSLSFLLLLTFIWYKFIRVRLPKEIPFELTEYSFIAILISICLYCFNIRKLFSTSKQDFVDISKIVKNINYYLYKPFTILLSYIIATFPLEFEKYYTKSILKIMSFNLTKFYFYSYVLIRFSIVIVFTIDVLYIHKVYFVYSLTLLVIILLLYRIITYLLEFLRDNAFESIDSKYNIAIIHPAYNQMCFINSQVMVDILSSQLIRKQPLIPFSLIFKYEYLESLRVEYNIDPKVRITSVLDFEDLEVFIKNSLNFYAHVQAILTAYKNITIEYKEIFLSIYMLYTICWTYILIVSISSLSGLPFLFSIVNLIEPFSELTLPLL